VPAGFAGPGIKNAMPKEDPRRMDLQNTDDPNGLDTPLPTISSTPRHPKKREPLRLMHATDDESGDTAYKELLEMYDSSLRTLAEGEVVRGRVLRVGPNGVIVDVGYKSEGIIDLEEFQGFDGTANVHVGDEIDVLLEKTENRDGYVVLSKEKAEKMKVWEEIERAYTDGRPVTGIVKERIKGGLAVDIGVRAFLPGSLVDVRPVRNLDALKGKELQMRVIKVNRKRGNIVLSRKAILEEENSSKKKRTLEGLSEGKVIRGTVKNITEYGAFIDLGGIDGLLHKTDMSWGRINHPSEMFNVGDEVEVVILKFDPEKERVSLGHKQRTVDPWENVDAKYPRESRVHGKVVSLTDYGAFVELESGVEGLIHISEMSWTKRVKHPSKVLTVGDTVEAVVLDVDRAARRLSLGLRQTEPNPWQTITERYHEGDRIAGKVRNLTDFGAFIEVEEGIDGLVHISDMSWTKRLKHPSEMLKKGDDVEAVILKIDTENQRLSLGIKQLQPNIWEEFFKNHVIGDLVSGRVVRLTDFGAFIEIQEGIEGLVHVSEIADERVEKPADRLALDGMVTAKIIKMDIGEQKIGLSIKAAAQEAHREDYRSYLKTQGTGAINLGEVAGHSGRRREKRRRGDVAEDGEDED
jgi:small subunit ribosomal protein S1